MTVEAHVKPAVARCTMLVELSSTGCTCRTKSIGPAPHGGGVMSTAALRAAMTAAGRPGGAVCRGSWQPMQLWCSPGISCVSDPIRHSSLPSESSAWKYNSVLAGALKYAEPSGSTGTVP
jgi:hypothetical protein